MKYSFPVPPTKYNNFKNSVELVRAIHPRAERLIALVIWIHMPAIKTKLYFRYYANCKFVSDLISLDSVLFRYSTQNLFKLY